MGKGISVFLGMKYSLEENLEYVKFAHKNGFDRVFTSLHIPEADYKKIIEDFKTLVETVKQLNMSMIADISPKGFEYLNLSLKDLKSIKNMGIDVIRVDFGFTPEEIAEFTRNPYGLRIEINGSTVTEGFFKEFAKFNPDFNNVQACHNYYPRLNTGISIKSLLRKNEIMKRYNIEISAFIPSLTNKRGPIYEGLPTLEIHRKMNPEVAAKHLYALGIDSVFFGDSIPSREEVESVGSLREDVIEFRVRLLGNSEVEKLLLLRDYYTNRSDGAEDVIRAAESRMYIKGNVIKPFNTIDRKKGDVTVDNEGYLRYMGELQICKKNLPADSRVNVVASIVEDELFLLDYIDEETKFKFKLI
ncbi:DUF871 domain-containing protein [Fonticella tunisiensis]|uniref:DUF871 domain-containing protein n=1 Tax=Fonticella tunisiensis TaxID=1096341 RepID=UPI00105C33C6|nr:MupG family TIM beta-alpha barrel fold protein [Fonticella tunisiensis]